MKTKIHAAGTAAGGDVTLLHCDSTKLELSIRSSNEVNAYLDRDLPAVARCDFNFEYRSEAVSYAMLRQGVQVGCALSGKEIQDIQLRKLSRTVASKAFARFVDRQNIAVKVEPKDNLVTQNCLHFFIGIDRVIHCPRPRIARGQESLAGEKSPT